LFSYLLVLLTSISNSDSSNIKANDDDNNNRINKIIEIKIIIKFNRNKIYDKNYDESYSYNKLKIIILKIIIVITNYN
jgi:hypothetical protein